MADFTALRIPGHYRKLREYAEDWKKYINTKIENLGEAWPPSEIFELLAIAQHHGVPSRLLDWTYSSYTAAYFAMIDAVMRQTEVHPSQMSVWALYREADSSYSQKSLVMDSQPGIVALCEDSPGPVAKEKESMEESGAFRLIHSAYSENPNLAAQRGLHTLYIPQDQGKEYLELEVDPLAQHQYLEAYHEKHKSYVGLSLFQFIFPSSIAKDLLRRLAKWDVTAATLLPGYTGVVKAIREQRIWEG